MEAYCTNSIPEGNSVMAYTNANNVVGVCLSGGVRRNEHSKSPITQWSASIPLPDPGLSNKIHKLKVPSIASGKIANERI